MQQAVYPIITRQASLPFYLTGIGISRPEYHVRRDTGLASHQFLITLSGEGVLLCGGEEYSLKPGSLFYIAPAVPHEYRPADTEWEDNWFVFRGGEADSLMSSMGFDKMMLAPAPDTEQLCGIFTRMLRAAADPVFGGERCSRLIYEYILEARRALGIVPAQGNGGDISQKAIGYMDTNFERDVTLVDIASFCSVSPQHLCRVFRAETGMRPIEYLAHRRISEAKRLLVTTDMSVSDIAAKTGFSNQNYFGITFRKLTGHTPTSYRRTRR